MRQNITIPLLRQIEAHKERVKQAAAIALREELALIFEESQRQVPKDTWALSSSGKYNVSELDDGVVGVISYGGYTVNPETGEFTKTYAMHVHENLHNYHIQGKAKFLEDPVNEAMVGLRARLAKRIREILEGGGADAHIT